MRKLLFIAILFFGITYGVSAQAPIEKGKAQINVGVGISSWGVPIYAGVDFGVHPDISVGGQVSYQSHSNYDIKYTIFGIFGRGDYHFNTVLNIPSQYDFYAGVSLGYYMISSNLDYVGYGTLGSGQVFRGR